MNSRESILTRLRTSLNQPTLRFPPPNPRPLTAEERMTVTHAEGTQWDLAMRFQEELTRLQGSADVFETAAEARMGAVSKILVWMEETAAARKGQPLETGLERHVLTWEMEHLPVPSLAEMMADMELVAVTPDDLHSGATKNELTHIRFGITGVEAAFASTGSMMMRSAPGTNRAAALLPFYHIALIPFSQLYATIEAWLADQRDEGRLVDQMRGYANFGMITGPSKSADIEGNLTLGVHGPKFVHAILFNDIA